MFQSLILCGSFCRVYTDENYHQKKTNFIFFPCKPATQGLSFQGPTKERNPDCTFNERCVSQYEWSRAQHVRSEWVSPGATELHPNVCRIRKGPKATCLVVCSQGSAFVNAVKNGAKVKVEFLFFCPHLLAKELHLKELHGFAALTCFWVKRPCVEILSSLVTLPY